MCSFAINKRVVSDEPCTLAPAAHPTLIHGNTHPTDILEKCRVTPRSNWSATCLVEYVREYTRRVYSRCAKKQVSNLFLVACQICVKGHNGHTVTPAVCAYLSGVVIAVAPLSPQSDATARSPYPPSQHSWAFVRVP